MSNGLTLEKLREVKRVLDEQEEKRPRFYIDGEEYVYFPPKRKKK